MNIYTYLVFCYTLSTLTYCCTNADTTELLQKFTTQSGENFFCALAGKTYCLNVTNYPRLKVEESLNDAVVLFSNKQTLIIDDNHV